MNKSRIPTLIILVSLALAIVFALQLYQPSASARLNNSNVPVGIGNLRRFEAQPRVGIGDLRHYEALLASQSTSTIGKALPVLGMGNLRRFEYQPRVGIGDLRRYESHRAVGFGDLRRFEAESSSTK